MDTEHNEDGQPAEAFNWHRRLDRGMDELVGMVRGVLADGILVVEEARFLLDWLNRNDPVRKSYFGNTLHSALVAALADGILEAHEEDLLVDMLLRFVGGTPMHREVNSYSTRLPLDDPPPQVEIPQRSFCFTGKFDFGSRRDCQFAVRSAGGMVHQYPVHDTNYVVIGEVGSRDWIHSNSGRKIERAIEIRSQGQPIKIVSEAHWSGSIRRLVKPLVRERNGGLAIEISISEATSNHICAEGARQECFSGCTIVVTGTMKTLDRKQIEELIAKLGGKASGSVSKKTSFVVAGDSAGSKLDKAKELGVEVITEDEFIRRAGAKK